MRKTFHSEYNGQLELRSIQGKKVLDTAHTNFGYGSLDALWQEVFQRFKIPTFNQSLVLGIGAGNVIWRIRDQQDQGKIYGVDIDPVIIRIASKEFGLSECPHVQTMQADANRFVRSTRRKFDLIVIDLFCDHLMPEFLQEEDFWRITFQRLTPSGCVLWNTNHTAEQIKRIQHMGRTMGMRVEVLKSKNQWNTVYRFRTKTDEKNRTLI